MMGPSFPRKDASGRIASAPDFLGGVLVSIAIGAAILFAIDGIFTLLGAGKFGHISGWLSGILAVWMFVDDFRAWNRVPGRAGIAILAGALALAAGIAISGRLGYPLAVFNGLIGVTVSGLIYAALWFFGVRWLAARVTER